MADGMHTLKYAYTGGNGTKQDRRFCITNSLSDELHDVQLSDGWTVLKEEPKSGSAYPKSNAEGSRESPFRTTSYLFGPRAKELFKSTYQITTSLKKTSSKEKAPSAKGGRASEKKTEGEKGGVASKGGNRDTGRGRDQETSETSKNSRQPGREPRPSQGKGIGGAVIAKITVTGQRGQVEHVLLAPTIHNAGSASHLEPGVDGEGVALLHAFNIEGSFGGLVELSQNKGIVNSMDTVSRSGLETAGGILNMVSKYLVAELKVGEEEVEEFGHNIQRNTSLDGLTHRRSSITSGTTLILDVVQKICVTLKKKISQLNPEEDKGKGGKGASGAPKSHFGVEWTTVRWADIVENADKEASLTKQRFGEELKFLAPNKANELASSIEDLTDEEAKAIAMDLISLCLKQHTATILSKEVVMCEEVNIPEKEFQVASFIISPLRKAEILSHSFQTASDEHDRIKEKKLSKPVIFDILPEYVGTSSRTSTDLRSFENALWMEDENLIGSARAVIEVQNMYAKSLEVWLRHTLLPIMGSLLTGLLSYNRVMRVSKTNGCYPFLSWKSYENFAKTLDPMGKAISKVEESKAGVFNPKSLKDAVDAIHKQRELNNKRILGESAAFMSQIRDSEPKTWGDDDKLIRSRIEDLTVYSTWINTTHDENGDLSSETSSVLLKDQNHLLAEINVLRTRLDSLD